MFYVSDSLSTRPINSLRKSLNFAKPGSTKCVSCYRVCRFQLMIYRLDSTAESLAVSFWNVPSFIIEKLINFVSLTSQKSSRGKNKKTK